jgi:hypothetical protein
MSIVVCKLPKAGLGNQLFPLMHALVFGKLNGLPVIITGYHAIKIGPWLRGEKSKRQYRGFFTFEKSWLGEASDRQKVKRLEKRLEQVIEPEVIKLSRPELQNKVFVFLETGDYQDYFRRLKDHREEVIKTLYSIVQPDIIQQLNQKEAPVIGIHIRMGDFRKLKDGETYQSGHVRPPQSLFVDLIKEIRKINGRELPVSVFTDGYLSELNEIFCLKKIAIVKTESDLLDLLLLSKSSLIIPTQASTFSAWSVFLSKATAVLPFNYLTPLRPDFMYEGVYEGEFQEENEKMTDNIKNIQQSISI